MKAIVLVKYLENGEKYASEEFHVEGDSHRKITEAAFMKSIVSENHRPGSKREFEVRDAY